MKNYNDKCAITKRANNVIHIMKYYSATILLLALTTNVSNAQVIEHNKIISNYLEVFSIIPLNGNIKHVKKEKIVKGDVYITELFFNKASCLSKIIENTENGLIESNPTGFTFYKIIDEKKVKHVTQNKNCQITSYFSYYSGYTTKTDYTYKNGKISQVNNELVKTTYFYNPDNSINKFIVRYDPSILNRTQTFEYKYTTNKKFDKVIRIREDIGKDGEKKSLSSVMRCTNPDNNGNPTKCIADDGTLINLSIDYYD